MFKGLSEVGFDKKKLEFNVLVKNANENNLYNLVKESMLEAF